MTTKNEETGESIASRTITATKSRLTSVTTKHDQVGYTVNVKIIETALREWFGLNDNSHILTAVAAHIWSAVCGTTFATWNQEDVELAIASCTARLQNMTQQLPFKTTAAKRLNELDQRERRLRHALNSDDNATVAVLKDLRTVVDEKARIIAALDIRKVA